MRHGLPQERTFAGAPRAVVTAIGAPWVRWNRLDETRPMVLVARNPDRIRHVASRRIVPQLVTAKSEPDGSRRRGAAELPTALQVQPTSPARGRR